MKTTAPRPVSPSYMKTRRMRLASAILALSATTTPALAAVIDLAPSGTAMQQVASNVPASGNTWAGLAQSFTAQDAHVSLGFYMKDTNAGSDSVLYSLYAGDGVSGQLLGQQTVTFLAGAPYRAALLMADFSSIALNAGNRYTLAATLPGSGILGSGTASNVFVEYAGTSTDVYGGGRFYFIGSPYDMTWPAFANRDLALKVAPVPEPETYAMLLSGLGLIGFIARRRNTA